MPPDPTLYAIPLYLLGISLEALALRRQRLRGALDPRRGYERRDTAASLAMGLGSILPVTLINVAIFYLANALWPYRLVDLGTGPVGWVVAMVSWDFAYYWQHRTDHEVRLLWACHVNHHSSERYHLVTALRQPWTPWTGVLFYPPLVLIGVHPWLVMVAWGLNLIYQFWVHTEVIGRLPRWFEYVFNTPSHHRVHHGSNPQYLDRNYGGICILWDRLFGTFAPEVEPVVYGLTKNIQTFNSVRIAFHEYAALFADLRRATSLGDRLGLLFRRPGWGAQGRASTG